MSASRSSFVTVLAWIFIVLSAMGMLATLAQFVLFEFVLDEAIAREPMPDDMPAVARLMLSNMGGIVAIVFGLMAATLAASIGLLRRREWARLAFIAIMLLAIAWNLAGYALQFAMFGSMSDSFGQASPAEVAQTFRTVQTTILIVGGFMVAGFCAVFAAIAWKLTRPAIRAEFTGFTEP